MRVLFVGGGSFIGAYAIRRLLADGHGVVAYDTNIVANAIHRILEPSELEQVRFVRGDVLDALQLLATAREQEVESIVHLAAALIPDCDNQPALATRINCDGLNHSFEVARILGLRRVVWASSMAVYGPPAAYAEECPDEDAAHFPPTVYGACKSYNEHLGRHYFAQFGVDTVGLRFTVVYGPGRLRGALAYELYRELVEKPTIGQPGRVPSGDALVNWQYVEDAAQAIVRALYHDGPTRSRVFNTTGDVCTVREAVACMQALLPDAEIEVLPGGWDALMRLSTGRIEEELGYRVQYPLMDGLRASINFLRRGTELPPI